MASSVFKYSKLAHRFRFQKWREFEVAHGNEDTFRDMLRIKRSVQAVYVQETVQEIHEAVQAKAMGAGEQDGSAMASLEAEAEKGI